MATRVSSTLNNMEDTNISSYALKLQGKAELPREIEIGNNYHISLEGSITNFTESDNDDGTHSRIYTFKPVKLELLDKLGKTIKLRDARSKSQLWRARVWSVWKEQNINMPFEQYYENTMDNLIYAAPEVLGMYAPQQ